MEILIQIAGWVGTVLIVVAYYLVSHHKYVEPDSKIYQMMNLLGAIGVGISGFHQHAWPSVALQVAWGIIAILALVKNKKRRTGASS
jgi:hypothetical protein